MGKSVRRKQRLPTSASLEVKHLQRVASRSHYQEDAVVNKLPVSKASSPEDYPHSNLSVPPKLLLKQRSGRANSVISAADEAIPKHKEIGKKAGNDKISSAPHKKYQGGIKNDAVATKNKDMIQKVLQGCDTYDSKRRILAHTADRVLSDPEKNINLLSVLFHMYWEEHSKGEVLPVDHQYEQGRKQFINRSDEDPRGLQNKEHYAGHSFERGYDDVNEARNLPVDMLSLISVALVLKDLLPLFKLVTPLSDSLDTSEKRGFKDISKRASSHLAYEKKLKGYFNQLLDILRKEIFEVGRQKEVADEGQTSEAAVDGVKKETGKNDMDFENSQRISRLMAVSYERYSVVVPIVCELLGYKTEDEDIFNELLRLCVSLVLKLEKISGQFENYRVCCDPLIDLCCKSLKDLILNDKNLNTSLIICQGILQNKGRKPSMRTFYSYKLFDVLLNINFSNLEVLATRQSLLHEKHAFGHGKEIDKEIRITSVDSNLKDLKKNEAAILESLFVAYLKILSAPRISPNQDNLLQCALKGLIKFSRFINLELLNEIYQELKRLCAEFKRSQSVSFLALECAVSLRNISSGNNEDSPWLFDAFRNILQHGMPLFTGMRDNELNFDSLASSKKGGESVSLDFLSRCFKVLDGLRLAQRRSSSGVGFLGGSGIGDSTANFIVILCSFLGLACHANESISYDILNRVLRLITNFPRLSDILDEEGYIISSVSKERLSCFWYFELLSCHFSNRNIDLLLSFYSSSLPLEDEADDARRRRWIQSYSQAGKDTETGSNQPFSAAPINLRLHSSPTTDSLDYSQPPKYQEKFNRGNKGGNPSVKGISSNALHSQKQAHESALYDELPSLVDLHCLPQIMSDIGIGNIEHLRQVERSGNEGDRSKRSIATLDGNQRAKVCKRFKQSLNRCHEGLESLILKFSFTLKDL